MYLFHFILGGILHSLIHYFSQSKQSKICALITALPILGIIGLMHVATETKNEINNFLLSTILFFTIYVFFFALIYFLYNKTNHIVYSGVVSFFLWLIVIYSVVCN
jgi:uncharacterized membrane protein (GlpM family)